MGKRIILGIEISNRESTAGQVQQILTEHGCNIKTRLGLHNVTEQSCSTLGLVILELFGKETELAKFEQKLKKVKGIKVRKMVF